MKTLAQMLIDDGATDGDIYLHDDDRWIVTTGFWGGLILVSEEDGGGTLQPSTQQRLSSDGWVRVATKEIVL